MSEARTSVAPDLCQTATDAEIEAWLGAESNEDGAFNRLMIAYHYGDLSKEHRLRIEERIRTEPEFRAKAEQLTEIFTLSEKEPDAAACAEGERSWRKAKVRMKLEEQGVNVQSLSKRWPHPRRIALRPWPAVPLEPKDFVRRLAAALGSDSAKWLVMNALRMVEETEKVDRWILAIRRARHRGTLSPAVAHFLIWELTQSAMMQWNTSGPLLSRLSAELQQRQHEFEHKDGEYWELWEGPPEWQTLYDKWEETFCMLFMSILLWNGESEILQAYLFGEGSRLYRDGRNLIFGF
jgi:hypothetical protein